MYETCEETPGTCPVCNNRLEDVINMSYKIRKKKGAEILYEKKEQQLLKDLNQIKKCIR